MKRKSLALGIAATALVFGVVAYSAAPTLAHGTQGYGGQMGHGYSQGMGHGYSMMGQGQGMGQGYSMMGQGQGMGQGYSMMGQGQRPCNQGAGINVDHNLGVDDVKGFVENHLKMMGNDRLKVGKVEARGQNTIVAEIVTVDDSLVRKIEFDTKTGAHHPIK